MSRTTRFSGRMYIAFNSKVCTGKKKKIPKFPSKNKVQRLCLACVLCVSCDKTLPGSRPSYWTRNVIHIERIK